MDEDSTVYLGTVMEKDEDNVSALNHLLIHWSIFSSEAITRFAFFLNFSKRTEEVKSCGMLGNYSFHKSEIEKIFPCQKNMKLSYF